MFASNQCIELAGPDGRTTSGKQVAGPFFMGRLLQLIEARCADWGLHIWISVRAEAMQHGKPD